MREGPVKGGRRRDVRVRAIVSTNAFIHKSGGNPGTQRELEFASVEEAKSVLFCEGHAFAVIPLEGGAHVLHNRQFGWEFHEGVCSTIGPTR